MHASWAWVLYTGVWLGELGDKGVREMQRLCVQEGPGREGDVEVMETLAVDELVSMEWSELQEEDSDSWGNMKKSRKDRRNHYWIVFMYIKCLIMWYLLCSHLGFNHIFNFNFSIKDHLEALLVIITHLVLLGIRSMRGGSEPLAVWTAGVTGGHTDWVHALPWTASRRWSWSLSDWRTGCAIVCSKKQSGK